MGQVGQVADGYFTCREEEPLFKAISVGDVSRVKALVMQPGTNLMLPSKPGWLAIHQAAWFGQDTCLKVLLSGRYMQSLHTNTQNQRHQSPDHSYPLWFCPQLSPG